MGITGKQLNEAFENHSPVYGGVKNDYFSPLYLQNKFNKNFEQVAENCAFGNNDKGIDAYFIDREAKALYLFQFKWSSNWNSTLSQIHESYQRIINNGIEYLFGNKSQDPKENKFTNRLKVALFENRNLIEDVFFYFIFNGDDEDLKKADSSARLESDREELENKNYYLKKFFNEKDIRLTIIYEANKTKTKTVSDPKPPTKIHEYPVIFENPIKFFSNSNELYLGFLPLWELYGMYKEMDQRFFDRNIRAGLSLDTSPNKSIRSSLKAIVIDETEKPETFTFNHNGVTISVENIIFKEDNKTTLVEPRILNGAQTITNFKEFVEKGQKDNPALERNISILKSIKVITKVILSDEKQFITNVTICNNKQNPVEPWNLHANDDIQIAFEDMFKYKISNDSGGIGYNRLENYYTNMSDDELEDEGVQIGKKIDMKNLAKVFLASQGEVDKMSRLTDVFENPRDYESTFRVSYLESRAQKIIISYKIMYRIGALLRHIANKAESYYYISKARNLVWALLIQALLNDDHLDEMCNDYGNDLYLSADFYRRLVHLAKTKIVRIIQRTVRNNEKYQKYLADDKYSFLRTKVFFDECMGIAKSDFKWQKKSF